MQIEVTKFKDSRQNFPIPKLDRIDHPTEGRRYVLPDGRRMRSASDLVSHYGDKRWLEAWRKRVGEVEASRISKQATVRGTAMHQLAESYLDANEEQFNLDYKEAAPTAQFAFNQLKVQLDKNLREIFACEKMMWSELLLIAGTPDLVCDWGGKVSVVDFKTSKKAKTAAQIPGYFLQTAAYSQMWFERTGMPVEQLVILLCNDETNECIVHQANPHDWFRPLWELKKKVDAINS